MCVNRIHIRDLRIESYRFKLSDKVVKKRVSVTLTSVFVKALDQLVEKGIYLEYQAAIRDAMRRLFQFHRIEPFGEKGAELDKETDA